MGMSMMADSSKQSADAESRFKWWSAGLCHEADLRSGAKPSMQFTVTTPGLRWLGVTALVAAVLTSFVVTGGWPGIVCTWLLFGGSGAALILMSATIVGTADGIAVHHLHHSSHVRWDEVMAATSGGGNLVLYTADRRISMPAVETWAGPQRGLLLNLVDGELKSRNIGIRRSARAGFHYSRGQSKK
jgi:hypothetical protein